MAPQSLIWIFVIVGPLVALYFAARRAITICELSIERGVVSVVRGGVAPPILADLRDIAKTPPIAALRIRIFKSSRRAEIQFRGEVSDPQAQRIRNVIGSVPLARLINAARAR